jgi:hypothetical protein
LIEKKHFSWFNSSWCVCFNMMFHVSIPHTTNSQWLDLSELVCSLMPDLVKSRRPLSIAQSPV